MEQNSYKKYSLLYTEDEETQRLKCVTYLKTLFYTVYEAVDREEALTLYNAHQPDILLFASSSSTSDILNLSRLIRQIDTTVPIIIVSLSLASEYLLLATELCLTKYLTRPLSKNDLLEAFAAAESKLKKSNPADAYVLLGNGYIWERKRERVTLNGEEIFLTKNERLLYNFLITNKNITCSTQDILYY